MRKPSGVASPRDFRGIGLVPKAEVGAMVKLDWYERPTSHTHEESIRAVVSEETSWTILA